MPPSVPRSQKACRTMSRETKMANAGSTVAAATA